MADFFNNLKQGLGQFINDPIGKTSELYNSASKDLEAWGKANPNWRDDARRFANAVYQAQEQGKYGLVEGTQALVGANDARANENYNRLTQTYNTALVQDKINKLKVTPLQQWQQEWEKSIQEIMFKQGLTRQQAIDSLKKDADIARQLKEAEVRNKESLADWRDNKSKLTKVEIKKANKALENDDINALPDKLKAVYNSTSGSPAQKWAAVRAVLNRGERQAEANIRLINSKIALNAQELDKLKRAYANTRYEDLSDDMKAIYNAAEQIETGSGWTAISNQIKMNQDEQQANTASTEASTAQTQQETAIATWKANNARYQELSDDNKAIFNSAYNNYYNANKDDYADTALLVEHSKEAGWLAISNQVGLNQDEQRADIAGTQADTASTQASTALSQQELLTAQRAYNNQRYEDLPDKTKVIFSTAYNAYYNANKDDYGNTAQLDEDARQAGWEAIATQIGLDQSEQKADIASTQASTALNQQKLEDLKNAYKNRKYEALSDDMKAIFNTAEQTTPGSGWQAINDQIQLNQDKLKADIASTQANTAQTQQETIKAKWEAENIRYNELSDDNKAIFNAAYNAYYNDQKNDYGDTAQLDNDAKEAGWQAVDRKVQANAAEQQADTNQTITSTNKNILENQKLQLDAKNAPIQAILDDKELGPIYQSAYANFDGTPEEKEKAAREAVDKQIKKNASEQDAKIAKLKKEKEQIEDKIKNGGDLTGKERETADLGTSLFNMANGRITKDDAADIAVVYNQNTKSRDVLRRAIQKLRNDPNISVDNALTEASEDADYTASQKEARDDEVRDMKNEDAKRDVDTEQTKEVNKLNAQSVAEQRKSISGAVGELVDRLRVYRKAVQTMESIPTEAWSMQGKLMQAIDEVASLGGKRGEVAEWAGQLATLEKLTTDLSFTYVGRTVGAISNKEMELFRSAVVSMNGTRAQNIEYVKFLITTIGISIQVLRKLGKIIDQADRKTPLTTDEILKARTEAGAAGIEIADDKLTFTDNNDFNPNAITYTDIPEEYITAYNAASYEEQQDYKLIINDEYPNAKNKDKLVNKEK